MELESTNTLHFEAANCYRICNPILQNKKISNIFPTILSKKNSIKLQQYIPFLFRFKLTVSTSGTLDSRDYVFRFKLTVSTSGALDSRDYVYCIIIINISIVSIQLISCHITKKLSYLILLHMTFSVQSLNDLDCLGSYSILKADWDSEETRA